MKKTFYIVLSTLALLCGCNTPKKSVAPSVDASSLAELTADAPLESSVADDTIASTHIVAAPIPEEWTTIKDDSIVFIESMSSELDSLLNSWYAQTSLMVDTTCTASATNPIFSDTVYTERLANLPCLVPMVYNQPVRSNIDRYATKLRHQVSYMLGMMEYYEPLIEQALDVHGVPNELKYLPVIESALNPVAVSRVGATGL